MSWDGLNPEFARRLNAFILAAGAAGFQISLGSGYRSYDQQARLYADYKAGKPGQARAAPPGKSNHNHGLAGDLTFGPGARNWAHANANQFGLFFPMGDEPWHIEGIGLTGGTNNPGAYPAPAQIVGPQLDPFAVAMSEIELAVTGQAMEGSPIRSAPAFDLVDDMGQSLTTAADPTMAGAFPALGTDPMAAGTPGTDMTAVGTDLEGALPEGASASFQPAESALDLMSEQGFEDTTLPGGSAGGINSSALMAAAGPNGALPPAAIAAAAAAAGFTGEALVTAVAVGLAESSGRPTVGSFIEGAPASGDANLTGQGETSAGIWQINYRPWRDQGNPIRDPYANADPLTNARNAFQIFMGAGGTFTDWTTFNTGAYQQHLATARQAVAEMGSYRQFVNPGLGGAQARDQGPNPHTPGRQTPSARMGESFRTPFRRDKDRQAAMNADRQPKKRFRATKDI